MLENVKNVWNDLESLLLPTLQSGHLSVGHELSPKAPTLKTASTASKMMAITITNMTAKRSQSDRVQSEKVDFIKPLNDIK